MSLELAILLEEQGRIPEILDLASEAVAVFGSLQLCPEAIPTSRMLRDAIGKREVTVDILLTAHSALEGAGAARGLGL